MFLIALAIFTVSIVNVEGFASFIIRIPNGGRVPNPCVPGGLWTAVGHLAISGGGPRNPFGIDFRGNSHLWTRALCQADSDGDGVSNGAELGDPNCSWNLGPPRGHPGICEPLDSPLCQGNPYPCETNGLGWETRGDGEALPASQEIGGTEVEGTGQVNDHRRSWHSWGHHGHWGGWGHWGRWGHHHHH